MHINAAVRVMFDDLFACAYLRVLIPICRYLASQNWRATERFAMTKVFSSDTLLELFAIIRYWWFCFFFCY